MKRLILLLSITAQVIFSQNKFEIFPDDLLIQPFTANIIEPKLGFLFQVGDNELRLDIGNSIDVARYSISENEKVSFGADLFTYTLLRGETDFHFPVDAVDYLFGINAGYKKVDDNFEYGARLRLSHISAHFVDGHYSHETQSWRDGRNPRVYSREFVEIMPYVSWADLRVYMGFTYLINVTPNELGKDIYQIGFDYFADNLIGEYFTPFIAYDFKLANLTKYTGNNSLNAGIKFGKPDGKGLSIYFHYYSGKSVHGEYFDYSKKYTAVGINLDL
ncbi:MAG: DUF1207 domain-containing protein [Ignavibacteriales bacterium]|jgi:hypothetical protein|nr:MAG: DUF1207 domain-containing protein [Ignavibacteriales bacterium]